MHGAAVDLEGVHEAAQHHIAGMAREENDGCSWEYGMDEPSMDGGKGRLVHDGAVAVPAGTVANLNVSLLHPRTQGCIGLEAGAWILMTRSAVGVKHGLDGGLLLEHRE